jgi:DNA-binding transcriptional regulator YiaG
MNSFSALDSNYRRGRCLSHIDTEGFTRLISDEYRRAHGFLTSGEIRSRAWLGMTQQRFSEYLGTGVASVKRWELGQIQDRAMDELMRLKTDLAAARKNLRSLEEQLHEHP